jgi:TolB-like protein/Tfp pilus assembly protein PilF
MGAATMTIADEPLGSNGQPTTVFVSYSRADRARAIPVIEALEAAGFSVWWDGLLEGGERFSRTTEAALEGARAVVVIWSKTSASSHWVHDEATRGRDLGRLVPLSIDGTRPPLGFGQFQTLDIPASGRAAAAGLEALVRAVAALHGDAAAIRGPVAVAPDRRIRIDRRTLIGGGTMLAAGAAAAGWWSGIFGAAPAGANSVAVLPFDNLSGDPDKTYFSDGLAAEVRAELARNPLLQVAAQTSSNRFRDSQDDARKIANLLKVTFLLDGNVRRSGDSMRISAELIEGRTGFSRWSQTFDRPAANIFAVQEEIAQSVTSALAAQMSGPDAGGTGKDLAGTTNLVAYDAYLRGRDLFDRAADETGDLAALDAFDRAIAADPDYALAHAARARSLTVIGNQYDQGSKRRARYSAAIQAAERAVSLRPDSADAQSALGFALFNGQIDAKAAREPYERSFQLGRGDADVLSRYALYSARCGRFDVARAAIARAAQLDPLNARTFRLIGEVEYSARRYAQSIPPVERALALNPKLSVAHAAIGASRLMLGQVDAARAEFALEPSSLFRLTGLAIIDRRQGRTAEAEKSLHALVEEHGDNSLYQQAQIYAQWSRGADAIAALLRALAQGDAGLVYVRNDPLIDPLRSDARFIQLLGRLGFA